MNSTKKPSIAVIGPGCVGCSVAVAAMDAGYRISSVRGGKDRAPRDRLAGQCDSVSKDTYDPELSAEIVLLTVPDEAIGSVCGRLADSGVLSGHPVVVHFSGALGSDCLRPAGECGCDVVSMHPLQTFPSAETNINGIWWFIEGDERGSDAARQLAIDTGGNPVMISGRDKGLYHTAAVFCSNYLTSLIACALDIFEKIGLDREQARQAAAPLISAAVENTLKRGPAGALTGPIERGDAHIISSHLKAIGEMEASIANLYRELGRRAVRLAEQKGSIDRDQAEEILKLLEGKE
jgi:predicted short-subunit dehydrogenase-like oxidoreductase (DUF2520 family)